MQYADDETYKDFAIPSNIFHCPHRFTKCSFLVRVNGTEGGKNCISEDRTKSPNSNAIHSLGVTNKGI